MKLVAAGLFAIAIAILVLSAAVYAARPYVTCTAGGGDTGLPPLTGRCS